MPRRTTRGTLATIVVAFVCYCAISTTTPAQGKEIEPLPDIWTRIGENDTLPAGMHVRIDMTTGEKWVKQIDPDEDEEATIMSSNGDKTATTVAVQVSGEAVADEGVATATSNTVEPNYDYDRMHATLAQLPPEEHERMGGLPELPNTNAKDPQRTAAERQAFERRMKEIWEQRQAELQKIQQEQVLDLPEVLKTQISFLKDYINGQGDRSGAQILQDLYELEFLVTDVDMARDFHTLQGWPWLLTILVHRNETSIEEATSRTETAVLHQELQSAAAWAVGTAVQNTGEFHPWVVEPVMLPNGTVVTALDGLMDVWNNQISVASVPALPQKVLYALSACLRGNPLAQQVFHQKGQAARLQQDLRDTPADTPHGRKQILRILQLGHDLLVEWQQVVESNQDGANDDAESVAAVEQYRRAWATPAWCNVVLDKSRTITWADKRLPIVAAWFPSCQTSWNGVRVRELLAIDEEDMDEDTRTVQQELLQKIEYSRFARE